MNKNKTEKTCQVNHQIMNVLAIWWNNPKAQDKHEPRGGWIIRYITTKGEILDDMGRFTGYDRQNQTVKTLRRFVTDFADFMSPYWTLCSDWELIISK